MEISQEDARMMFNNSLVRIGTKLFYVIEIRNGSMVLFDLEGQQTITKKVPYDKVRAPTSRLGYVNFGGICVFVARNPVRKYKVGISKENVSLNFGDMSVGRNEKIFIQNMMLSFTNPALIDTFNNNYPTLKEALRLIKSEGHKFVAFDRQFAVDADKKLYYKGNYVGEVGSSHEELIFLGNKEYLKSVITNIG